ncbi:MAG: hypothetical protein NVSMB27_37540 [Ktedonobacteraceae bacterium]
MLGVQKILQGNRWITRNKIESAKYRSAGDRARDERDWAGAAENYRKHLAAHSDDVAIWVQLGHSLKEGEDFDAAEAAYQQAVQIGSDDADAQLQLAHFLKMRNRPKQAAIAFRECMRIAPSEAVYNELRHLGFEADAAVLLQQAPFNTAGHRRYFELRDLFEYLLQHTTVTGISRVVLGLITYVLEEMPDEESDRYCFVHQFGAGDALWLLPKANLHRIAVAAMAPAVDHQAMLSLINEIKRVSPFVRLQRGDLYFIPGAFWDAASSPTFLPSLKGQGIYVGAYIYDLIPITHAHYCMAGLTEGFNIAFAESAACFDFTLTISKFVAEEVQRFLNDRAMRKFPIIPVALAHELQFHKPVASLRRRPSPIIEHLAGRNFVLCVCTIEARKNHIYLFYIWQEMINEGLDVPDLVFVGRYGWRVTDLIGQIDASHHLDGRLHILQGLSDADLGALYDACLFTVFPSFVEGWGLPVGESLAHGKVCVASSESSIPEVGGNLAVYIDPFNMRSGHKAIRDLIVNPGLRKQLEAKIKKDFVARTWKDVGAEFFSKIDGVLASLPPPDDGRNRAWPNLRSGEMLSIADLQSRAMRRPEYVLNPLRMIFAQGWRNVEESGTWIRDQAATLRFNSGLSEGTRIIAFLCISTSNHPVAHNTLQIWIGETDAGVRKPDQRDDHIRQPLKPDERYWARVRGKVGGEGLIVVNFRTTGAIEMTDPTSMPVLVRLHNIGFSPEQDMSSRMDLLEQAALTG